MRYRLAGATYSVIAEKLTEDRALEYADAHDISVELAMKKIKHVSTRTAWDDVLAEFEGLRRETEITRGDAMAMENTRIDQLYSKALALYSKGSVPAGRLALSIMGRRASRLVRRCWPSIKYPPITGAICCLPSAFGLASNTPTAGLHR